MKMNLSRLVIDGRSVKLEYSEDSISLEDGKQFSAPEMVYELFRELNYTQRASEYVWVLCLDTSGHLLDFAEISHGGISSALIEPKEIFQRCMLHNAAKFILVHNHPSGDCTPSNSDLAVTRRLSKAGCIMNIPLIDSIIIGPGNEANFVSILMQNRELFEEKEMIV